MTEVWMTQGTTQASELLLKAMTALKVSDAHMTPLDLATTARMPTPALEMTINGTAVRFPESGSLQESLAHDGKSMGPAAGSKDINLKH
ncbi:MAG: hypothetical protein RBR86_08330 [Pseudobdellovibrionaceae bacterium]|jgi:hypothetical protein|nr:hypothetical protein [Pseudobdellovibrionaceae bacterium]